MAAVVVCAAAAYGQVPEEDVRCLNCHGQATIATSTPQERATMVSTPEAPLRTDPWRLYVDREALIASSHRETKCIDCHQTTVELPHPAQQPAPTCSTVDCHAVQGELFLGSVHAQPLASDDEQMPHCWTCHGDHDILPATARRSRIYPLNVLSVCGGCHEKHRHPLLRSTSDLPEDGRLLVGYFRESEHGRGILKSGLIVAATCPDCHRAHDVQPSDNPFSSVSRPNVPTTCGQCHVGVAEQYADGIHSRLRHEDEDRDRVPVCTNCHTSHQITRAGTPTFARDIVEECGTCHENLYATYHESYHGQARRLGNRRAASCSNCHGAHRIERLEDPQSQLGVEHKIAMCERCHQGANENFVKFLPHADHRDPKKYPLLYGIWMYFVIVISATFTFFGIHTVLWWVRSLVDRIKHGQTHHHREAVPARTFQRFRPVHRFTHVLVIVSFLGLTVTGIPLKFSYKPWAVALAHAVGGGNMAGILHRLFACVMFTYVFIHLTVVVKWALTQIRAGKKSWLFGPESMLPRWKDLRDMIGMFKWFVGLGPMPKFDRFTYWEKFDYMADAFGTVVIGGSGLLLAFPIASSYLLPGWMFNVAMIIHGYEALLAIAFIFTIHFFNAHLRLQKFPMDMVVFTGEISEHEMQEERPLEYERLKQEGRLDELLVAPKPPAYNRRIRILGIGLLIIGLTLVVLIIWAGLSGFVQRW